MSKISELSDGGSLLPTDDLIVVRSGGNVRVKADTINVDQIDLGDNEKIRLGNAQDLEIYWNGSTGKITNNIDVTGTVTADGATIAGTLELDSNSFKHTALTPSYNFIESDIVGENTQFLQASGTLRIRTVDDSVLNPVERLRIDHGTGDISFYEDTGTTAKLFWDASAESLGIGTTSFTPADGANIELSSSTSSRIILDSTGTGGRKYTMASGTNGSLDFYDYDAGQYRMRIDSAGNVGIGTVTPASIAGGTSTSAVLTVGGGDGSLVTGDRAGSISFKSDDASYKNTFSDGITGEIASISESTVGSSYGMSFYTGTVTGSNRAERMRIDASGNVGIGTSSPTSRLHLDGAEDRTGGLTLSAGGQNHTYFLSSDFVNVHNIETSSGSAAHTWQTNGAERLRIDASGKILIGDSASQTSDLLQIETPASGGGHGIQIRRNDSNTDQTVGSITFGNNTATDLASISAKTDGATDSGALLFNTSATGGSNTEAMRIDASGDLLVGKTTRDTNTAGIELLGIGAAVFTYGGAVANFNRTGTNGNAINISKDGSLVGSIGVGAASNYLAVGNSNTSIQFYASGIAPATGSVSTLSDNTKDIGSSSVRWNDAYITNGVTTGSDANDKQDIETLSDAEQRVAVACKGLLRKWRWKDAVEDKGDEARIHFGIIAQDLQAAFETEGLDAGRYAMFMSNTWTDEETGEERTRLGVRYHELLAFIIAAI